MKNSRRTSGIQLLRGRQGGQEELFCLAFCASRLSVVCGDVCCMSHRQGGANTASTITPLLLYQAGSMETVYIWIS